MKEAVQMKKQKASCWVGIQVNVRKIKVYYYEWTQVLKYNLQKKVSCLCSTPWHHTRFNATKHFVFCTFQFCYSFFLVPFHFFFVILSFIAKLPDGQLLCNKNAAAKMYMAFDENTEHDIEYESATK